MRYRLTIAALGLMLASAFALYAIKYDTRLLEERVRAQRQRAAGLETAIAVLTAERASLTRPDLLARQAHAHLALGPLKPGQLATVAELPWREDVPDMTSVPAP